MIQFCDLKASPAMARLPGRRTVCHAGVVSTRRPPQADVGHEDAAV
jgi:hypothetical protein